jgi:hypothetical protein
MGGAAINWQTAMEKLQMFTNVHDRLLALSATSFVVMLLIMITLAG